jgi:predicted kinase
MMMPTGTLIEFGGLPGTGKSTLARQVADRTGAVWVRVDEIEGAMRRNGLTAEQTGITAYSVAHDIAASHLRRGLVVIADAVNPVAEARDGWRDLAQTVGARHLVIETICPDVAEHRRRVESRGEPGGSDLPGWIYPDWEHVDQSRARYQPRDDRRLTVDTTRPFEVCQSDIEQYLRLAPADRTSL